MSCGVIVQVLKWVQRLLKAFTTINATTRVRTNATVPFQIRSNDLENLTSGTTWPNFGEGAGVRKYQPLITYVASLRIKYDEWVARVDELGRTATQVDTDASAMLDSLKER